MSERSYSLRDNISVHDPTVSAQEDLERQLRLAKMQVLDLESKMKRMKSKRIESNDVCSVAESKRDSIVTPEKILFASADKSEVVRSYINSLPPGPSCSSDEIKYKEPYVRPVVGNSQHLQDTFQTAQLLQACMSLPPRPIPTFDGNPMLYYGFIRNFNATIARNISDSACLLDYLIASCKGEAAEAIRRCNILDPATGYQEALRILERRFGEPHIIARNYIEELTEGPMIRKSDTNALVKLADEMKVCSATLKQLNYVSDLNACRTLSAIVQRLPYQLQQKWFEKAASILKLRREPTFDELNEFISDRGDAAVAGLIYTSRQRKLSCERNESKRETISQRSSIRTDRVLTNHQECISQPSELNVHYINAKTKRNPADAEFRGTSLERPFDSIHFEGSDSLHKPIVDLTKKAGKLNSQTPVPVAKINANEILSVREKDTHETSNADQINYSISLSPCSDNADYSDSSYPVPQMMKKVASDDIQTNCTVVDESQNYSFPQEQNDLTENCKINEESLSNVDGNQMQTVYYGTRTEGSFILCEKAGDTCSWNAYQAPDIHDGAEDQKGDCTLNSNDDGCPFEVQSPYGLSAMGTRYGRIPEIRNILVTKQVVTVLNGFEVQQPMGYSNYLVQASSAVARGEWMQRIRDLEPGGINFIGRNT